MRYIMAYGVTRKMTTIDEFIVWTNRRLGSPMMNVELANESIVTALYDAVDYANEYGYGFGSYLEYYCFNTVKGQNEYQLPDDVMAVVQNIGEGGGVANMGGHSHSEYLWSNSNYLIQDGTIGGLQGSSISGGGSSGLLTYFGNMQSLELINRFFNKSYSFRYQEPRNALLLTPMPTKEHAVVVKVYKREMDVNLLNNHNVKNLALAYAKQVYGSVLSKYSLTLAGGSTINGESIKSEGNEEATKIEENIRLESEGLGFFTSG